MEPIGSKPIGFYGLSMIYTMWLFLDGIHLLKLSLSKIMFYSERICYDNDRFLPGVQPSISVTL